MEIIIWMATLMLMTSFCGNTITVILQVYHEINTFVMECYLKENHYSKNLIQLIMNKSSQIIYSENSLQMFFAIRKNLILMLIILIFSGLKSFSQETLPIVTVRFANPQYDCTLGTYCLDVEFQCSEPGRSMVDMNVRFFYDSQVLEYESIGNFEDGYYLSGDTITILSPASGPELFGFEGPATYWNGAVTAPQPLASPVYISTTGWTRLFSFCFNVVDVNAFADSTFCPSLIWELKENPIDGGYAPGSEGVVIILQNLTDPNLADPALENVEQFNWDYTTGSAGPPIEPWGLPEEINCIEYIPLLTYCPTDTTLLACTPQADIDAAFSEWLAGFRMEGGCDPVETMVPELPLAPDSCGGLVTVTYTVTEQGELITECVSTFTVIDAPLVSLTVPADYTGTETCLAQSDIDAAFASWLAQAEMVNPGCGGVLTRNPESPLAPDSCGGSITVEWTVTSDCEADVVKSATFTIPDAPLVSLTVPADYTGTETCMAQSDIDAAFATWLAQAEMVNPGC
ncbi:MAG: hypothetical protein GX796_10555, partial [Clostridiaceae bacterium]|nr:hypothetical protein [Clostridiaceae bacterium]